MRSEKLHLMRCWDLPSELPPADASIIVGRACDLLKQWKVKDADAIALEFNFPAP